MYNKQEENTWPFYTSTLEILWVVIVYGKVHLSKPLLGVSGETWWINFTG